MLSISDDSVLVISGGGGGLPTAVLRALSEQARPTVWLLARTEPAELTDPPPELPLERRRAILLERIRERAGTSSVQSMVDEADHVLKADAAHRIHRDLETRLGAGRVHHLGCDLLDPAAVTAAIDTVFAVEGRVDVVVHAAGISAPASLERKTPEVFRAVRDTKVVGYRNLKAAFADRPPARWCNIGSVAGAVGLPGDTDYASGNDFLAACAGPGETTLAFPLWDGTGLGSDAVSRSFLVRQGRLSTISPAYGTASLLAELGQGGGYAALLGDNERGVLGRQRPWALAGSDDPAPRTDIYLSQRVAHDRKQTIWRCDFDADRDRFLHDHLVDQRPTVPGTMLLELAARAARQLAPDAIVRGFRNARFEAFVRPFSGRRPSSLRISGARVPAADTLDTIVAVDVASELAPIEDGGDRLRRHFRTEVVLTAPDRWIEPPRRAVPEPPGGPVADPYRHPDSPVRLSGIFAGVASGRAGDGRAAAIWSLPAEARGLLPDPTIPWPLLDSVLRMYTMAVSGGDECSIFVPRAIDRLDLYATDTDESARVGGSVLLFADTAADGLYQAIGPDGTVLAEISGLTMAAIGTVRSDPHEITGRTPDPTASSPRAG
ncbi:SDR family NAD(P)-dependent oxidoreductase [Nocardia wallacei]|uniref:SDR family NAD(P)-dependent oxidoreductase n=1 Tax=Nocardia wallacei TaxID=480035 RepID=UPI0024546C4F|nr:SDR family NAD(P)-dependent oxidoreductase [Nocardia wallacei]